MNESAKPNSRRDFLSTSGMAVAGAALASSIATRAHAAGDDVLKVGLVGCGGRGTGAAIQALSADKNVKLIALADTFSDQLENALTQLKKDKTVGSKVAVADDHKFVGFDAYKKVIETCDVVLLCTAIQFRPLHLKACVEAGKHVFAEKPVAVDGPGVRSILESCEAAKKKNLSIVSGLCYRYEYPKRETIAKIHDGSIGDIVALQTNYLAGPLRKIDKTPAMSEMEWQVRNWWYFTWLSGDIIVEQHVHSLDKIAWAMKDEFPIKAVGSGGRQQRIDPAYGHIYDHFNVIYEWKSGVKCFSACRQYANSDTDVSDYIMGTKGTAVLNGPQGHSISGENKWKFSGKANNMYQTEHDELFAAIRSGKPINNGDYMAKSTLMAIMGRMSAYTGKTVTWEQALNSKEDLTPPKYEWGALPMPPVPMPGFTKLV